MFILLRKHAWSVLAAISLIIAGKAATTGALPPAKTGDHIELPLSDPSLWIIDTTHLGTKQVALEFDPVERVAVVTPTWSKSDASSEDTAVRNVQNSCLYLYQAVAQVDCTQAESVFEVSVPAAYVEEGMIDLVFSLQGGKENDYLYNGRLFSMKDFEIFKGVYRTFVIKAGDYGEPEDKRRGIQRVGLTIRRNGSMVSAPIRIRKMDIQLHSDRIVPEAPEVRVQNPASRYVFDYTTAAAVERLRVKVSKETMEIARTLDAGNGGVALKPLWGPGEIPAGHTGNVYFGESLGAPHDFSRFEVRYLLKIPRAYFDEGKLDIYACIQAGETGHYVWSGVQRPLSAMVATDSQEVEIVFNQDDLAGGKGKKRSRIEFVGLQLNRHGSSVTAPIIVKRISVSLDR